MASPSFPRVQERTSPLKTDRRKALNEWEGEAVGHDTMRVSRCVRCGPQIVVFAASCKSAAAWFFRL
jgi:hypothetical protein